MRRTACWIGLATTLGLAAGNARADVVLGPISASGYNLDGVVENSVTDPTKASGAAKSLDHTNNAMFQAGYRGDTSVGLPDDGKIAVTAGSTTINFALQPYVGNNVLSLNDPGGVNSTGKGTLTLGTPGAFSQIALLGFSTEAGGRTNSDILLHFSDGTSDDLGNAFFAPDWFLAPAGAPVAYSMNARVNLGSGGISKSPNLTQFPIVYSTYYSLITLSAADQAKQLQSITLTMPPRTQSGGLDGFTYVLGVSGAPIPAAVPEPSTLAEAGLACAMGLVGAWLRRRRAIVPDAM